MLQSKRQKEENNDVTAGGGISHRDEDPLSGLVDAWKRICEQDGLSGLYKGVGPSLWLVSNPIIRTQPFSPFIHSPSSIDAREPF